MERAFPQILDAFAIPLREFNGRRQFLLEMEYANTPEGAALRAEREKFEREQLLVRMY